MTGAKVSRRAWQILAAAGLLLSLVTSGCGNAKPDDTNSAGAGILRVDLGPEMRAYHQADHKAVGILVWFHGMDSDGTEFAYRPEQRHFAEPFLRSGWVVASATAGGNSFGNDASLVTYRRLIAAARAEFGVNRLLFVGESMGSLAALRLYEAREFATIDGFVGISPLTGLPATIRDVSFIKDAWNGRVPERADPLSYPEKAYAGKKFQLYYSLGDTVVPSGAGARAFAIRFGKVASVQLEICRGAHVDPTCYQGDAALRFATSPRSP